MLNSSRLLDMPHLRNSLVDIARAEIGFKETDGNNRGKEVVEYQSATWLPPGPWPWCAAFVCWCLKEWHMKHPPQLTQLGKNLPRGAGAFWFLKWAKSASFEILPETAAAKKGDLVVYDFSHIGIVSQDQTDGCIQAIEGNTAPNTQQRDSSGGGDGVWERTRYYKLVLNYIRLI